jgi:hypothetical protein
MSGFYLRAAGIGRRSNSLLFQKRRTLANSERRPEFECKTEAVTESVFRSRNLTKLRGTIDYLFPNYPLAFAQLPITKYPLPDIPHIWEKGYSGSQSW